jgi:hypothetical protein
MKQLHVVVDALRVNPHKLQQMLDELSVITTVHSSGIIEYDETNIELEKQIQTIIDKYYGIIA